MSFIPVCHFGYFSVTVGRQSNHKRHTGNSKQLFVLFFFEGQREWKQIKVCNKEYKCRGEELLERQTFQNLCTFDCKNNVNLLWNTTAIDSFKVCLNTKWKELSGSMDLCFPSSSLMFLFLICCSFQELKPPVWKAPLWDQVCIFSRMLTIINNRRKNWKLVT